MLQKQRINARSVQQTPVDNPSQVVTNDQFYKIIQEHNPNNNIPFDEAIISKLEASPYRQKLYFKKLYQKNGQQRAPSVQLTHQGAEGVIQNNPMFPPAEYFSNIKSIQMRHTQQQEGFKQVKTQRNIVPRSGSLLGQRIKQLNGMASPPKIQVQQSFLPQTIIQKLGQSSTIQTSVNISQNDNLPDQDYQQQSKISSRGIRFYNQVVERFENKFYQKKTRPSSIKKEDIYDENIQLKHQMNQFKEHLTLQKTQNKLLNNELEKQQQLMMQVIGQSALAPAGSQQPPLLSDGEPTIKQTELIGNLKRELDKALKDLSEKETEIKAIHKQVKVTKYKELEEECKMYMNECFRLHKVLKKFLIQSGLAKDSVNYSSQQNLDQVASETEKDGGIIDKLRFYKNKNFKLLQEVKAHAQRYEIQSQQIKNLHVHIQSQQQEIDLQKPLIDQNKALQQEIEKLKLAPPLKVIEQPSKSVPLKDDPKFIQMKKSLERLEQDIIIMRQEKGKLKDQCADQEQTINSLESQLAQLRTDHFQEMRKVQESSHKLDQQIQNLQTQLNNAQTEKQQLQQQLIVAQNQQSSTQSAKEQDFLKQKDILDSKISTMQKEIATLQYEKMKVKSDLEGKLQDVKDQYEQKVVNLVSENNKKDLKLLQLKDQADQQLKQAQPDQTEAMKKLSEQLRDKDAQIKSLNESIDQLNDQIRSVSLDYDKMKQNVSLYMSEVEILKQRKSEIVRDTQEEEKLKLQVTEINNQVEQLSIDLKDRNQEISTLKELLTDKDAQHQGELEKKLQELDTVTEELESLQKQLLAYEQQIQTHDQQASQQSKEDKDLMVKLEQLMVSLQLKEQDMHKQGETISQLKEQLEAKVAEMELIESQLNEKDAEITTVKSYFEKIQNENEKLLKDIDTMKRELTHHKSNQDLQPELLKLQQEVERLTNDLDSVKKSHLLEIEIRFRRCLEILQINDVKGLSTFLKSALTDKNSEEDLEEYISMKFNMDIKESTLFLNKVLGLTESYTKQDIIEQFIAKVGKHVKLLEKEQVAQAYKELTVHIVSLFQTVQQFLNLNSLDSTRVIHFYLLEKMIRQVLSKTSLQLERFTKEGLVAMLITHLLSQSRNFYQIDTRILHEYLLKYEEEAESELNKRKQITKSDKPAIIEHPSVEKPEEQPLPPKEEDMYEYYEELDEEERKLMMDEEKQKDETFGKAINHMKDTKQNDLKDTNQSIHINTQMETQLSERNKQSAKKPTSKKGDHVLQQIAEFLVNRKINLRQFLKVYHVDPMDIPFQSREIEALKLTEFVDFVMQQEIFTEPEEQAVIDESLEKSLQKAKCIQQIESLGIYVIEHDLLVEILSAYNYQDYQKPKSVKNFDVSRFDLKTIRIVNRLTHQVYKEVEKFMTSNQITVQLSKEQNGTLLEQVVENLFKSVLKRIVVRTNNQNEKVYLIQMEDFYSKMVEMGIRRKKTPLSILSSFLQLNAQYSHYVYVKKLTKLVEMFNKNGLMAAIGSKKVRLVETTQRTKSQVKIATLDSMPHEEVKMHQPKETAKNQMIEKKMQEEDEYDYGFEYGEESETKSPEIKTGASPVVRRPLAVPQQQQQVLLDLFAPEPPRPISQGKAKQLEEPPKIEENYEMEEYYDYYDEDGSPKK